MPYVFALPTTSSVNLADSFKSDTHPSLVLAAATQRNILRSTLKHHKRLSLQAQSNNISIVLAAIDEYLPYLLTLDAGLSGKSVHDEEIDIVLQKELEVEWRCPLAPSTVGAASGRVKGQGLEYELAFVLHTKASISTLQARNALQTLMSSQNDRKEAITQAAVKAKDHLLNAESIHKYLSTRGLDGQFSPAAVDVGPTMQSALSSLALAEATLMVILSQDPYPAAVLQSRDKDDREWMYKARDIPKVRASLCARLALRAAEYAERTLSLIGTKADRNFVEYLRNLAAVSRAKACRFFAIDADLGGKVGDALAWLVAGKKYLGYKVKGVDGGKVSSLSRLKMEWKQKRDDKKVTKGARAVLEGGTSDEARALDLLEEEFEKTNDLISHQIVPPSDSLTAAMPSGRDVVQALPIQLPSLDQDTIAHLRAPIDQDELARLKREITGDSDNEESTEIPGAFPESTQNQSSSYY